MREKIAVAISGAGRTLDNLIRYQKNSMYQICGVISSRPEAKGLMYARAADLPVLVTDFSTDAAIGELPDWLADLQAKGIVLAGFTRRFPTLSGFKERTVSIHPSLLPKFGGRGMFGMHVHRAVFAANDEVSGATVHLVTEEYDEGRVIAQISVNIVGCDSAKAVHDRVFAAECWMYPRVVDFLIQNSWRELPPLRYEERGGTYAQVSDQQLDKCS